MRTPSGRERVALSLPSSTSVSSSESKWNLAFCGLFGYLVIEYSRLPEMFPLLQPLQLGKVAVGLAVVGMILSTGRRRPNPGPVGSIDACLAFFLFVSVLSASFADHQDSAWLQVIDTLQWCVIYFIVSRIPSSTWRLRVFVFVLLLLNLKLAQFVIRNYVTVRSMRGEEFLAVHGVGAGSTGFFGNAGDLGVAMCVVWPLAGAMFVAETRRWRKWFFAVCFFAFLGAIVASSSRGAMVGAAVVALVGFLRSPKRTVAAFMMLGVVLAFFLIASGASRARMQSALDPEHDKTANDRLDKWRAGMRMFSEHPVLGVGPANFVPEYLSQHPIWQQRKKGMAVAPHSIYVEGLSELGIAGFVPLLSIWLLLSWLNARTRKLLRSMGPERCRGFEYHLSWGLDLALVGYLVSGAFLTVLYYPHLWVLLGLSAALHRATVGEVNADQAPQLENWKRPTIRRELSPTGVS
jgi:putative inorganic carbon (HCO3(-)) transporter